MQDLVLRKAARQKAKIRLGLSSVSGGGKTFSAILLAKGLTNGDLSKVAIIDTENGSADLYAHMGNFSVVPLTAPYSPERYINAIQLCESAGMEVIIIDSIAHEWEGEGGILNLADSLGGGFQGAWKQLTPRHDKYKNAILASKCHVITTVRRKQEYILVEELNKQGRSVQKPVKAGMKEITREGWEYELTVNLELGTDHTATASKDRTNLFTGKEPFIISEKTGALLREWCETGADIQTEINIACNKLSQCETIDQLTVLKDGLPDYVKDSDQFKKMGLARYQQLQPQAAGQQQQPPAQQGPTPPAQTPYNKKYTDSNVILGVVKSAANVDELSQLYFANSEFIDKNQAIKDAIAARRDALKNQGKVIITASQYSQVCDRIIKGDATVLQSAISAYVLTDGQKDELQHLENQRRLLEEALAMKYSNPSDIATLIEQCTTTEYVTRLHKNNAMVIDRDPDLTNKINGKLRTLKTAA